MVALVGMEEVAMTSCGSSSFAQVTYRATGPGGREVEIQLIIDPSAACIADAWSRLTEAYPAVDPLSLEIEIRRIEPVAESALAPHRSFELGAPGSRCRLARERAREGKVP
jgi:hypothetical protein